MLQYLPALGGERVKDRLGLIPPSLGIVSGLRTAWKDILKILKGKVDVDLFPYCWFKDLLLRPSEKTVCIFDSGLYSAFGLVKKDSRLNLEKFFENYVPAYRDYINYIFSTLPKSSWGNCYFVNLDTDFLLGLEQTRKYNDFLLENCPEKNLIGTYHAADGKKYLDELIEKFDYIAIAENNAFKKSNDYLDYAQAVSLYIKSRNPNIKIHVLGKSTQELFRRLGNLADTCDSSSFRFLSSDDYLDEVGIKLSSFLNVCPNLGFCGGIENGQIFSGGLKMTEMQYLGAIIQVLRLYGILSYANKYSKQVVRGNCPVRDFLDGIFHFSNGNWDVSGGNSSRYLIKKNDEIRFSTEPEGESWADLGSLCSEYMGKRKQDWSREFPKPFVF